MTMEQFSIILESISFLCVTLDLYGKERLEKLQSRLSYNIGNVQKKGWLFFLLDNPIISIIIIILLVISSSIIFKAGTNIHDNIFYLIPIWVCIIIISLIAFGDRIIFFILSIMEKYKLDGILLGFGTILFFASKLFIFFK